MTQKETVRQFNDFIFKDNDSAFAVMAEDATMEWPGWRPEPLRGRDAIRRYLETNGPDAITSLNLLSLVEEGDEVIGHGSGVSAKDGQEEHFFFADCYKLRDGKISQVVSYMVLPQKKA